MIADNWLKAGGSGSPIEYRSERSSIAVSEIQGIGRIKFHEGKLEEFEHLSTQAMEIARTRDTGPCSTRST